MIKGLLVRQKVLEVVTKGFGDMTICQKCGVSRNQRKLVYCIKCDVAAEHRYCLDKMANDDEEVHWMCYDCTPEEVTQLPVVSPSRKSERICSKKEVTLSRMELQKQKSRMVLFNLKEDLAAGARAFCRSPEAKLPKGDIMPLLNKDVKAQNTNKDVSPLNKDNKVQNTSNEGSKARERKRRRFILPDEDSDEQYDLGKVEAGDKPSCNQISGKDELEGEEERMALEGDEVYEESKLVEAETEDEPSCNRISRNQELQGLEMVSDYKEGEGRDGSKPAEVEAFRFAIEPEKYVPARPADYPIWKGRLNVKNATSETMFGIWAYASTRASPKVASTTRALPFSLDVEKTSRVSYAWPNSFSISPPTIECIGIFLYPVSESDERIFDGLLAEMIEQDLALKASISGNVELLVFSSSLLPPESRRHCRKYFLWGVYRTKKQDTA